MHQQYSTLAIASSSESLASVTRDTVTPREWLAQWPTARRSLISNLFHKAVRAGVTTLAFIVTAVQADLRRRLRYATPWLAATDATLHAVLQALQTTPQEAYPYAQAVLDWEGLSYDKRQRQKQELRRNFQQEYMTTMPPTAKQLALLRSLGCTGPTPSTWAAASAVIDTLFHQC